MLGISPEEIRQRVAEDYEVWLAWANEPVRPYVVIRLLACVYQRVQLSDDALEAIGLCSGSANPTMRSPRASISA